MGAAPLVEVTDCGLFCRAAGCYIDPWKPVERAIVTHAHADHATPGCKSYLASPTGKIVLARRVHAGASIDPIGFGETIEMGDARITLFPAGHILGSAQVRIEHAKTGETWVVTGDYKTRPDPTCEAFEPVRCHTLLTESTFGLPIYRWDPDELVKAQINAWWRENTRDGRTSVVFAYALGKAQRVLGALEPSIGPIGVHGAVLGLNEAYAEAGIGLPVTVHANTETAGELKGRGLIVAPPSAAGTPWLRRFAGPGGLSTAMVSGWMRVRGRRRWRPVDRGFVLSDHADWPGLLDTVRESGAERVGVTHGSSRQLARYLAEQGLDSFVVPTRYEGEPGAERDDGPETEEASG